MNILKVKNIYGWGWRVVGRPDTGRMKVEEYAIVSKTERGLRIVPRRWVEDGVIQESEFVRESDLFPTRREACLAAAAQVRGVVERATKNAESLEALAAEPEPAAQAVR